MQVKEWRMLNILTGNLVNYCILHFQSQHISKMKSSLCSWRLAEIIDCHFSIHKHKLIVNSGYYKKMSIFINHIFTLPKQWMWDNLYELWLCDYLFVTKRSLLFSAETFLVLTRRGLMQGKDWRKLNVLRDDVVDYFILHFKSHNVYIMKYLPHVSLLFPEAIKHSQHA